LRHYDVATIALFVEYEAVLTRPEHLTKSGKTVAEAEIVLDALAAVAAFAVHRHSAAVTIRCW